MEVGRTERSEFRHRAGTHGVLSGQRNHAIRGFVRKARSLTLQSRVRFGGELDSGESSYGVLICPIKVPVRSRARSTCHKTCNPDLADAGKS